MFGNDIQADVASYLVSFYIHLLRILVVNAWIFIKVFLQMEPWSYLVVQSQRYLISFFPREGNFRWDVDALREHMDLNILYILQFFVQV